MWSSVPLYPAKCWERRSSVPFYPAKCWEKWSPVLFYPGNVEPKFLSISKIWERCIETNSVVKYGKGGTKISSIQEKVEPSSILSSKMLGIVEPSSALSSKMLGKMVRFIQGKVEPSSVHSSKMLSPVPFYPAKCWESPLPFHTIST